MILLTNHHSGDIATNLRKEFPLYRIISHYITILVLALPGSSDRCLLPPTATRWMRAMQNLHRSNLEGPGHGAAGSPSNQVFYVYKSNYCINKWIYIYILIYIYYNIYIYIIIIIYIYIIKYIYIYTYIYTSVMDCSGSKFKPQGTADVLAYDNCYSISHLIVGYYCVAQFWPIPIYKHSIYIYITVYVCVCMCVYSTLW